MSTRTGRIDVGLADIPEIDRRPRHRPRHHRRRGRPRRREPGARRWWPSTPTTSPSAPAGGAPSWCTAGCATSPRGQVDVAHESAVERGILMRTTAPHLIRALPMLMPLTPEINRFQGGLARVGLRAGDLLRLGAHTDRETLPASAQDRSDGDPHPRSRRTTRRAARWPPLLGRPARGRRPAGARGRPHRRRPRRPRAHPGAGQRADRHRCRAHRHPHRREPAPCAPAPSSTRPACGPATWSRRSGCGPAAAPTWCCARTPCRASAARSWRRCRARATASCSPCPQPDETFYVGLTDEEVEGEIPDVPSAPEDTSTPAPR